MPTIRLRVPESQYPAVRRMLSLTERESDSLATAIQDTSPTLFPQSFASNVAAKLDLDDTEEVVLALVSMYRSLDLLGLSVPDLAGSVAESLAVLDREDLQPPGGNWEDFERRLITFLSAEDTLGTVAKASTLFQQNERTLHEAQIITDIRAVFKDDPAEDPSAAIIFHTFRFSYHEDGDLYDFLLSLSGQDLRNLRTTIDRAEAKANTLKRFLDRSSMTALSE